MIKNLNAMKKPDPINTVQNNDTFSAGLMEKYSQWMDGDTFQGTEMPNIHEAPFDGMDPQSHGAEIEDITVKKKETKKVKPVGSIETAPVATVSKEEKEVALWDEVSQKLTELHQSTGVQYKVVPLDEEEVKAKVEEGKAVVTEASVDEGWKKAAKKKVAKIMSYKK